MKKLLCVVLLAVSGFAQADGFRHDGWRHRHYEPQYRSGANWIGPALIGGIIGYEISRQQQMVVVQQPPIVYPPVSAPPYPPYGYHYEQMLDAYCNCYRVVLVQN
jgi:hypothetical protein